MNGDAESHANEQDDESHPTDEEQVETEWHLWLFAMLLLGGVALVLFPLTIWPQLGIALIALAVAGFVIKTVIEKSI